MQKSRDNKKTKDFYNDQTYESIKTIMSYSKSLQMINKNAIMFYQKNLSKQLPCICLTFYSDFVDFASL